MKNKGLKVVFVIGIIILLSIVSFFGFYQKGIYQYEDQVPSYLLGDGVTGHRTIVLKPEDAVKEETEIKPEEAEEGEEGQAEENKAEDKKAEEVDGNTSKNLTVENYEKSKEITQKRLSNVASASYYTVRLDRETGKIHVDILDNSYADTISTMLAQRGDFRVIDEESKEVLLNNDNIKDVKVQYTTGSTGGTIVFVNIELKKDAKATLQDISKTYVKSTDENGNEVEKKVTIRVDGNDLISTSFAEEITSGSLQLTVGSETTDMEKLQDYLEQGSNIAVMINGSPLPVYYAVDENVYTSLAVTGQEGKILIGVAGAASIMLAVYLVVRFRKNGILSIINLVGAIAALLLVMRYTNVILTTEAISGIVVTVLLGVLASVLYMRKLEKDETTEDTKKKLLEGLVTTAKVLLPLLIINIILCFMTWLPINSFAMTTFWGISLILLFQVTILRTLILGTKKK